MKLQVVRQIPPPEQQNQSYQYITIDKLPEMPDGTFLEIQLNDMLDYIETRLVAIEIAIQKLRSKGQLILLGTDIVEVAKAIIIGTLTIDDSNKILYTGKKSLDNIFRTKVILSNFNMILKDSRLNDYTYYIQVEKQ